MRRFGLIFSVAAGAIGMLSGGGDDVDAAVVSGSNLTAGVNGYTCYSAINPTEPRSCTLTIGSLPSSGAAPGGFLAGADGVVVSWTIKIGSSGATHEAALQIVRSGSPVGSGPRVILPEAAGEYTFPASVPVSSGDELGIDAYGWTEGTIVGIAHYAASVGAAKMNTWIPPLETGQMRSPSALDEFELLINATIEPDADHDGYGDETQDQCPTSAGSGPCPRTEAPAQRPDTAITRGPKGTIHSRSVRFEFRSDPAGASFECKFDKRKFKTCASPRKYKHLGFGKHRFQVRAVSAAGTDSIPAARSFKIAR